MTRSELEEEMYNTAMNSEKQKERKFLGLVQKYNDVEIQQEFN